MRERKKERERTRERKKETERKKERKKETERKNERTDIKSGTTVNEYGDNFFTNF